MSSCALLHVCIYMCIASYNCALLHVYIYMCISHVVMPDRAHIPLTGVVGIASGGGSSMRLEGLKDLHTAEGST